MYRVLFSALVVMPAVACAGVYKCEVGGKVEYQGTPCAGTVPASAAESASAAELQKEFNEYKQKQTKLKSAETEKRQVKETCERWKKSADTIEQAWDGAVPVVRDYILAHLKNPDSIRWEQWGKLNKTCDGYLIFVRFRAENSFGGNVMSMQVFEIDKSGNNVNPAQ